MFKLLARLLNKSPEARLASMSKPGRETAESWKKGGNEHFQAQRLTEALACYRRALEIDPEYGDAQWNAALASLFAGDYAEGFKHFESRYYAGDKAHMTHLQGVLAMLAGKRLWYGEPLRGENLLIWTEQGFGDSLMFLRYLPRIGRMGNCYVLVACERELVRMMRWVPGVDEVMSKDEPLPADRFDLHCSLLSLPQRFGTTMSTLPNDVPYLSVPAEMKLRWRERIGALPGIRVGLVWAGGSQLAQDHLRSVALKEFEPLMHVPGASFVSLQKGEPSLELQAVDWPVIDWMDECPDFLDTAALTDELDLVISVDTAVAHLAGALGKPVWLLNRFESEWRWMLEREDSPWYPSMRIFRQPAVHEWSSVIRRTARELESLAAQSFSSTKRN